MGTCCMEMSGLRADVLRTAGHVAGHSLFVDFSDDVDCRIPQNVSVWLRRRPLLLLLLLMMMMTTAFSRPSVQPIASTRLSLPLYGESTGHEADKVFVFKTLIFNASALVLHEMTYCLSCFSFFLTFMDSQSEFAL